ncbi:MAG: sigma-70 family RNA polymerase sigma factor [Clostridiales bacterium]|nr:sigma-70 family RNA polymerase sigma factor [Clostridiales bacterium]
MTREDFGERVTALENRLYHIARGYLKSEPNCLDAVSEAIVKAWQKRSALRDERLFETWLVRILIRECINIRRGQKRVVPMETPPEDAMERPADHAELRDALDSLPEDQRVAVVLHYLEGYSVAEIASLLHTFRGTVSSRLHYARLALRDLLKEDQP